MNIHANRKLTEVYIAQDPTTLSLTPTVEVRSPTGGVVRTEGVDRQPQTFKLIALSYAQRPTVTVAGVERLIDYHLLGQWDSTMEVGDHWSDDAGNRYEIVALSPGHGYCKKGYVEKSWYKPEPINPPDPEDDD